VSGRRGGALVVALLLFGVAPVAAPAHSLLLESSPAANSIVEAPSSVSLRFNNRVEKRLCRVRVVDDAGHEQATAVSRDGGVDRLVATLPPLARGAYRVEWQVLSTDGHVVNGSYAFRVR